MHVQVKVYHTTNSQLDEISHIYTYVKCEIGKSEFTLYFWREVYLLV